MGQQVSLLAQLLPEPSPIRPYVHPGQYRCIPNVRHYSDGMSKAYSPNLATTLISAVTLAAYISIPHMMLGLFVAAFFSRTALALLAVLMATLLLPAKPLRVPSVLSSYLFLCWRRYFKFSYLFEVSLDSYQDYIVAQFPHGAFPLGALLGGTFMATEWPEYPCYALAANAAFWVPIWRHVHSWLGTEACTKTNFHRLLAKGVKGPLPPHRHHHHHHHSGKQQQQEGEGEKAGAEGVQPQQQQQQQQQRAKSVGGTPFNCTAVAAAAAADGVTAVGPAGVAAAAAAEVSPVLGTFASAAVLPPRSSLTPNELTGGAGYRGWSPLSRRTSSAPLGRRLSAALSLPTSVFRAGHTLSDTESSESDASSSSSSSGDGLEDEDGGCSCGSGLSCKTPGRCAAARRSSSSGAVHGGRSSGSGRDGGSMGVGLEVAIVRAYGVSDSGSSCSSRSSSSSGGASCCGCCGACSVLAEVHSLPLDPFARKQQQLLQQQHSLVTIPSDEMEGTAAAAPTAAAAYAAVECDDDSGCRLPLLGQQQQQHYQQQRLVFRRLSSPAAAAPAGDKEQQQVLSQLSQQSSQQQQQQQQQSHSSNYQIDPATGERKLGVSVGLMVGGIAEMFMIRKDHERIKLKDRKGFVRIAVEHGVDLIPCYMFGVNQCLDFGPPWLQRLSRRLRASLGVIYGVWGLPIPRRVPIFKVTGKPLVVGPPMRKDHPDFAARVDELHALFCVEIERLYYAHREKYGHGFENKPLVIC